MKSKKVVQKTRKQIRKEQRKQKKAKRHEYYTKRSKGGKYVLNENGGKSKNNQIQKNEKQKSQFVESPAKQVKIQTSEDKRNNEFKKEKREHQKLKKEMEKQRRRQLQVANDDEDRNIKQLEKQLKLNKRKSKSVPKSFAQDGLDYLLEVCESDNFKGAVAAEQQFTDFNDDFEEDFALMTGKEATDNNSQIEENSGGDDDDVSNDDSDGDVTDEDIHDDKNVNMDISKKKRLSTNSKKEEEKGSSVAEDESVISEDAASSEDFSCEDVIGEEFSDISCELQGLSSDSDSEDDTNKVNFGTKRSNTPEDNNESCKKVKVGETEEMLDLNETYENPEQDKESEETWEDIYGRMRGKDGSILTNNERKYIPPALRAKTTMEAPTDKKQVERLNRLKKVLKGLLNRLAESNMHNIATQIEELYMNNSRNDMNDTLTTLIFDALVSHVLAPERLLIEHVLLLTILHANVGMEIGAHFLQTLVKRFDELFHSNLSVENKMLDNVVCIIAQLYNFKVFHSQLLYQMFGKLSERFTEKDVECILLVLKNVGFSLRKDDPLALKNLIIDLQKKANAVPDSIKNNSRIKYMVDILLAIKNNNMSKIPNYDTNYSEHLKKLLRGFIRKGLYVTSLNISLEDLLKADERGKWWVVGSAWTGKETETVENQRQTQTTNFSQKLLDLAQKQRMNTDTRRNVFCIIMSAEDYLDAFEKILHLGLKNQQEREIIHVILHCCLQEKDFNPYYAVLAQKFCDYDRKFQMTIKCSIWDKLKTLPDCSTSQLSNLAKLLTHLFLEKALPISTLKIVQFSELDKITLRFMRQILLGVLLCEEEESCIDVFDKGGQSEKLKMFKESLRLFIKHFLLRNLKTGSIPEEQKSLLENRAKMVDKVLSVNERKMKL